MGKAALWQDQSVGSGGSVAFKKRDTADLVLCPTGQDESAPDILSMQFGIIITELQGSTAYTMMQAHPWGTVASVEMIRFDAFDVTGRVHQAIGRVHGNGYSATEIVPKKAIGTPLAGIAPSFESVMC